MLHIVIQLYCPVTGFATKCDSERVALVNCCECNNKLFQHEYPL